MNKNYNLKLDLQFRCNNSIMKFNQFDNNTSDFFMRITNGGNLVDIEKALVVLAVIKPSGKVASQFVEVKNGLVYADLKPSMKDEIGTYTAKAMLILEDKKVVTNVISYEVEEDKIFSLLNDNAEASEEFTLLTDMLSRLSTIEISEEQRVINEAERILSEENRKIEEAKRVEAELIRQHEEADRAKYDAIRESNENIRKQNESTRLANETNRIDEEAKRVDEENKRKLAEEERNANYNFMTEDEERRRSEANAHKEAENLRVQAETNRVNEEAKRRTTEQARVSAENTRVSNENTRKANETTRQNNETKRVEAETQRQNRYNSFIADAEANANNFENYTNSAKIKEEERKSNELDRKSQEARRVSNEVERISNENTRKANEVAREKNETSRQNIFENKVNEVDKKIVEINATKENFVSSINTKVDTKISELNTTKENFISSVNTKVDNKISELDNAKSEMTTTVSNKVNEVETRFNALTSSQQQDAEVIDARDGETSLKARLDRDIEKAKQVYVNVEGSNISTDSSSGYAKGVEILGNTIQDASNLADIRSVGDKVEGQELYEIPVVSCGKNLFNGELEVGDISDSNGSYPSYTTSIVRLKDLIKVSPNTNYCYNFILPYESIFNTFYEYDKNKNFIRMIPIVSKCMFTTSENGHYISFKIQNDLNISAKIQIEEGTVATPYEPYIEDKLTILSPTPLEKVGDVADRIIEKDGVWGVEKNVESINVSSSNLSIVSTTEAENTLRHLFKFKDNVVPPLTGNQAVVFNLFNYQLGNADIEHCRLDGATPPNFVIWVNKDRVGYNSATEALKTMEAEGGVLRYCVNPQFIPLPHDQQVKLRTFAGKTNISFLTEIEGAIKAQVPKSIGATVNTHTEQISNLNKELDRVKKLEENTVSTVTTESDFTTVEATSNGYFEDVKLEGKTLVNLAPNSVKIPFESVCEVTCVPIQKLKADTDYTIIMSNVPTKVNTSQVSFRTKDWVDRFKVTTNHIVYYRTPNQSAIDNMMYIICRLSATEVALTTEELQNIRFIILEGDHTQNPPSYFEGLKSVGDGADEIVVESVNSVISQILKTNIESSRISHKINPIKEDFIIINPYTSILNVVVLEGGNWVRDIQVGIGRHNIELSENEYVEHINQYFENGWTSADADLIKNIGAYTKQDKKRLLYYNEETQTWEKPILREWDSIEKHANGKYYYHKRSAEVVLNGSENWLKTSSQPTSGNHSRFIITNFPKDVVQALTVVICDKYNNQKLFNESSVGIYVDKNINITVDGVVEVEEFKNNLNTNNVTVVYQLAEEKVYECTNIDLITYANETNYVVESGAIVPKTTLKVHNNISNVVSLLQKKVSLLESNVKASQEVQDMMILETDMRMLDIELALMEFIPMKLNLGGSNMLRSATYFNFLKNHIINETYEKEYLENVMNKYLATGRINQDEYDELYKMLYPPVYDIELPIEY